MVYGLLVRNKKKETMTYECPLITCDYQIVYYERERESVNYHYLLSQLFPEFQ